MKKMSFLVGGLPLTVGVACPNEAEKNGITSWSLKPLRNKHAVIDERSPLVAGLRKTLRKMGTHYVYAPNVTTFSARIVDTRVPWRRLSVGDGRFLHVSDFCSADGVLLSRGRSFIMSGSGCPIILASGENNVVVAHAGRDSLIDRGAVGGKPTREHVSVVDAIVDAFAKRGTRPPQIEMLMLFSIPAAAFGHPLDHPIHGKHNRLLADFLRRWPDSHHIVDKTAMYLDLEGLFLAQAEQAGVSKAHVAHPIGQHPELAHTRDGKDPSRRNLIVVKRDH